MAAAQQPGGGAKMRLEDFDIAGEIARGAFGVVYKVVRKADGRVFALKQVKLAGMKRVDRQEAIDEARVLSQLNHPHVTKHYDSFIDKDDKLNIIMEYASKGSVAQLIKSYKGKGLPEDLVWKYTIQALLGLNHIHSKKIIHRDIKALNLFLDAKDTIKIGDLGIARSLSDNSDFAMTIVGTPYYLAPEVCEDKPYNEKSDVWALGVVMYEMCTGHYPFEAQNEGALIRKILRGQFQPVSGPYTASLVQMVNTLMTFKPQQRPDTSTLLRNPNIVAKAKALGIDLNPKPNSGTEDVPVYASAAPQQQQAYAAAPAQQMQQQQAPGYPYPYPGQPQQQQYMRPGSARGGVSAQGSHPFDLPQGMGAPGMPYPGQGGHMQPGQRQPAQAAGAHPFAMQQQQQQPGMKQFDEMVAEIERLQMGGGQPQYGGQAKQQQQYQQQQYPQQPGQRDNLKDLLRNEPQASMPAQNRARPEELPPAGMRPGSARGGSAPFALHYQEPPAQSMSQSQSAAVWTAKYSPPQYGRRRCPELQITGPSLRGGSRPGSARAGGYVPAADDATTYVSSSYNTTYYK